MKIKDLPRAFNVLLLLVSLALNLSIDLSPSGWEGLNDPADYLHQSEISLFSKEFYAPHKTIEFNPRPFTVPLFYKFCGSNPDIIIPFQKCIHSLSVFLLVSALLLFIRNNIVKYLLILAIYLLMSWWNILGWSMILLSESISTSLLFCWIATFLFWFKKRNNIWLIAHLVVLALFSFSRDSWPYIIVSFDLLVGLVFYFFEKRLFKGAVTFFVFSLVLFLIQQASAKTGRRSELPVINSIVVRIMPNKEHRQWFIDKGMPCASQLQKNFAGMDIREVASQEKMFRLYRDSSYQEFFHWVIEKGQATYILFMMTHPAYVILMEETQEQKDRIWAHNLFYTDEPRGYSQWVQSVFPLFNLSAVLLMCAILAAIWRLRKNQIYAIVLCLTLIVLLNAWLCYNVDALEVERHLFTTGIMLQVIGFFSIALIVDSLDLLSLFPTVRKHAK